MKVIEKSTGNIYTAKEIEGGFEILNPDTGERYKRLKESSLKRLFKKAQQEKANTPKPKKDSVKPNSDTDKKSTEDSTETAETTKSEEKPKFKKRSIAAPVKELNDEERERMIDKIKKILALAQDNPSMEEGLAAALQAQKLMAKYNIHEDDVTLEEIKDEIGSVFTEQKHNSSLHSWRKPLAVIIARNFRCKCYMKGQDVVFRGYISDANIAKEVFTNLYTMGDRLGSKLYMDKLATTGSGKGVYNSYVKGFLRGIEDGLGEQCTALMVVIPKEVEEEYKTFSANFKKTRGMSAGVDDFEAYSKGHAEGRAAVKARSIEKKGK